MVGVGEGGEQSVLARVSIVNFHGHIILDQYVLPRERVTDYRTHVSGITPKLLKEHGKEFTVVQRQVADILKNRIIVGHALKNDLNALLLTHPPHLIRDTATYKPLKNATTNKPIKLKTLVMTHLSLEIQEGEHSSVDDARAVMELFKKYKSAWEQTLVKFEFRKVKETSQDQ